MSAVATIALLHVPQALHHDLYDVLFSAVLDRTGEIEVLPQENYSPVFEGELVDSFLLNSQSISCGNNNDQAMHNQLDHTQSEDDDCVRGTAYSVTDADRVPDDVISSVFADRVPFNKSGLSPTMIYPQLLKGNKPYP